MQCFGESRNPQIEPVREKETARTSRLCCISSHKIFNNVVAHLFIMLYYYEIDTTDIMAKVTTELFLAISSGLFCCESY